MKNKLRTAIVFLTGVLVTTCFFQFVYPPPRDAMAYSDCIRTGLTARLTNGDIGRDQTFMIAYSIPNCYAANGYQLKKAFIFDGQYVAATYYNPNFTKTSTFGSGSSGGGGMSPLN